MIVCICHRISDRDIAQAAQAGCADFDELQFLLAVATTCGKCHDCAQQTFDRHAGTAGRCAAPSRAGDGRLQRLPVPIALLAHGTTAHGAPVQAAAM